MSSGLSVLPRYLILSLSFFTALHECRRGLAMRILLSARMSVRLSKAWFVTKWKKDRSRFLYYTKDHLAWFSEKKNGWWGATSSTWNFGSTGHRWSGNADFQPIFTRISSAVTSSEKTSINVNRKCSTRFPMSLRWSSYVAPKSPKGVSKTQNGRFPSKIALRLKKVCYKVSLCKNCQRQSCKAFIGLTNRAKMIGGGLPLVPEILDQTDRVGAKSPIFDLFSLVAPQPQHPSEKCSINTNRKSTTRFPMSPRWTSYVVPKSPKGSSKTQGVQNLNNKLR